MRMENGWNFTFSVQLHVSRARSGELAMIDSGRTREKKSVSIIWILNPIRKILKYFSAHINNNFQRLFKGHVNFEKNLRIKGGSIFTVGSSAEDPIIRLFTVAEILFIR